MTYSTQFHWFGTTYEHSGPLVFYATISTQFALMSGTALMVGYMANRLCGQFWPGYIGCLGALALTTMRISFS